jgi:hypothetical protein
MSNGQALAHAVAKNKALAHALSSAVLLYTTTVLQPTTGNTAPLFISSCRQANSRLGEARLSRPQNTRFDASINIHSSVHQSIFTIFMDLI